MDPHMAGRGVSATADHRRRGVPALRSAAVAEAVCARPLCEPSGATIDGLSGRYRRD